MPFRLYYSYTNHGETARYRKGDRKPTPALPGNTIGTYTATPNGDVSRPRDKREDQIDLAVFQQTRIRSPHAEGSRGAMVPPWQYAGAFPQRYSPPSEPVNRENLYKQTSANPNFPSIRPLHHRSLTQTPYIAGLLSWHTSASVATPDPSTDQLSLFSRSTSASSPAVYQQWMWLE